MKVHNAIDMPKKPLHLIVFSGPPCSGKTPLSRYMAKHADNLRIEQDKFCREKYNRSIVEISNREYLHAFRLMRDKRNNALKSGKNVIIDAGASRDYQRKGWLHVPKNINENILKNGVELKRYIIKINSDKGVLYRRFIKKYKGRDPKSIDAWLKRYEPVEKTISNPKFENVKLLEFDTTKISNNTTEGKKEFERIANDIISKINSDKKL